MSHDRKGPARAAAAVLNLLHDATTADLAEVIEILARSTSHPDEEMALQLAFLEMRCRMPQVLH